MYLFKDKLYKPVDGIGMGSTLGCTMANFLVGLLETLFFKDQIPCTLNYMFTVLMMCLPFSMMLRVRLF